MTFVRKTFSSSFNHLVLAGLLATAGISAMAQGTAMPAPPPGADMPAGHMGERMGRHDPAKMQVYMAKRQAELKAKLKITAAQEGAWTTFTTAMQPPAGMGPGGPGARPTPEQRAEFDKLTTPERIDKMRVMRVQHMAEMTAAMDKRGDATKAFYAALTPEQQKVFDAEPLRHGRMGERGGKPGHGGHGPSKG